MTRRQSNAQMHTWECPEHLSRKIHTHSPEPSPICAVIVDKPQRCPRCRAQTEFVFFFKPEENVLWCALCGYQEGLKRCNLEMIFLR